MGKTTIAHIIAQTLDIPFYTLSAISAGVKDVREVIEKAGKQERAILFLLMRFTVSTKVNRMPCWGLWRKASSR